MVFNFNSKRKQGDVGEGDIIKGWPKVFDPYTQDNRYDLTHKASGMPVEVKTEYYRMNKTVNFFIERYSDDIRFKDGGLWRALKDGVKLYTHYFKHDKQTFWFNDLANLVPFVENIVRGKRLISIPNKTYNTLGYLVPRELLKNYYVQLVLGEETEYFDF